MLDDGKHSTRLFSRQEKKPKERNRSILLAFQQQQKNGKKISIFTDSHRMQLVIVMIYLCLHKTLSSTSELKTHNETNKKTQALTTTMSIRLK